MTSRLLPRDEWHRLKDTELGLVVEHYAPDTLSVIVVEDDAGQIVGCWGLFMFLHAEGLWIAPKHRGRSGVGRALIREMQRVTGERGVSSVITGSVSALVDRLITRFGGSVLPGRQFVLPMRRERKD